ncbi:uncharacterized protein V6R79_022211 [Siganus canaliculatus]
MGLNINIEKEVPLSFDRDDRAGLTLNETHSIHPIKPQTMPQKTVFSVTAILNGKMSLVDEVDTVFFFLPRFPPLCSYTLPIPRARRKCQKFTQLFRSDQRDEHRAFKRGSVPTIPFLRCSFPDSFEAEEHAYYNDNNNLAYLFTLTFKNERERNGKCYKKFTKAAQEIEVNNLGRVTPTGEQALGQGQCDVVRLELSLLKATVDLISSACWRGTAKENAGNQPVSQSGNLAPTRAPSESGKKQQHNRGLNKVYQIDLAAYRGGLKQGGGDAVGPDADGIRSQRYVSAASLLRWREEVAALTQKRHAVWPHCSGDVRADGGTCVRPQMCRSAFMKKTRGMNIRPHFGLTFGWNPSPVLFVAACAGKEELRFSPYLNKDAQRMQRLKMCNDEMKPGNFSVLNKQTLSLGAAIISR